MKHEKLSIAKQLKELWRAGAPWEHLLPKYSFDGKELKVDFTCGNYIIFTEIELKIKGIAYPYKQNDIFNIGDTRMIDKIEAFVSENII